MDLLKSDINELHQERLNCDAVISNLPINQHISTDEIVKNILQYVNMSTDQVAGYYNVMKNKFDGQGKIHNIFIKFKSPELQNKFLLAKKRSGPLLYQQLFFTTQNGNTDGMKEIYINERLTIYNLELLRQARKTQKNGYIKYAWHQRGSILIRQNEQSPIRKIKMISNLQSFDLQQPPAQLHDHQEHQLI
jgi:hypothetical protein